MLQTTALVINERVDARKPKKEKHRKVHCSRGHVSERAHVAHFNLKGNFTQKRRYLLAFKPMKSRVKFCIPQIISRASRRSPPEIFCGRSKLYLTSYQHIGE